MNLNIKLVRIIWLVFIYRCSN